ncbi:MAG: Slp family lipoprotein, partial [Desulfobacterales bacterium]|nr:Slp family lipoprotein [Desulfobacterales bacterium]
MISSRALREVDQSLSFERLLDDPEAYKGKTVLVGGTIINTRNFPDRTLITVLQRPLGFRNKPTSEDI